MRASEACGSDSGASGYVCNGWCGTTIYLKYLTALLLFLGGLPRVSGAKAALTLG
jgi:hypothetical protein